MSQRAANDLPPQTMTNLSNSSQSQRLDIDATHQMAPPALQGNRNHAQTPYETTQQAPSQAPSSGNPGSYHTSAGIQVQGVGEARLGTFPSDTSANDNGGGSIVGWFKKRSGKHSQELSTPSTPQNNTAGAPNDVNFRDTSEASSFATHGNMSHQAAYQDRKIQREPEQQPRQYGPRDNHTGNPRASTPEKSSSGSKSKKHRARDAPSLFQSVDTDIPNIVIFGETGTGKSSVINMLSDVDISNAAKVSNSALGCTFGSTPHAIAIDGIRYNIWDTAGLNEGEAGNVPAEQALYNLRELVNNLKDGISLLVYCIKGSRYRDILKFNYDIFTQIICQQSVPVVVVITGLENESPMDNWWIENSNEFKIRGIVFDGHACITASPGKKNKRGEHIFEEEYEESKVVVREFIKKYCPPGTKALKVVDQRLWLERIGYGIQKYYQEYNGYSQADNGDGRRFTGGGHLGHAVEDNDTRAGALPGFSGMNFLYLIGAAILRKIFT